MTSPKITWKRNLGEDVLDFALAKGVGNVIVVSSSGTVHCLDKVGKILWVYTIISNQWICHCNYLFVV